MQQIALDLAGLKLKEVRLGEKTQEQMAQPHLVWVLLADIIRGLLFKLLACKLLLLSLQAALQPTSIVSCYSCFVSLKLPPHTNVKHRIDLHSWLLVEIPVA